MDEKECYICGCKKGNVTVIGGYPTKGERMLCPNYKRNPELHNLLERKAIDRDAIQDEIVILRKLL